MVIRISKGSKRDIDASILFTLLEELRNSGAEVIEINDIRVITSTYISDTADGLDCDGTNIKAPFIIRAIGDSDNLQNAVNLAGGVGSRLKVKYGATVSIAPSDKVEITSTRSAPQYRTRMSSNSIKYDSLKYNRAVACCSLFQRADVCTQPYLVHR